MARVEVFCKESTRSRQRKKQQRVSPDSTQLTTFWCVPQEARLLQLQLWALHKLSLKEQNSAASTRAWCSFRQMGVQPPYLLGNILWREAGASGVNFRMLSRMASVSYHVSKDGWFSSGFIWSFPGGSAVKKEFSFNAGDMGLIPGLERSPGEENNRPLQYSCLENPMDRGAWQATVYRVAGSDMTEAT